MPRLVVAALLALTLAPPSVSGAPIAGTPMTFGQWSARTGSTDRDLYEAYDTKVRARMVRAAAAPAKAVARTPADVVKVTWDSFTQVGLIGFAWTLAAKCRQKLPLSEGVKAARASGMRWGGISAGFSGGTAAAVVGLRKTEEDKWCSMVGSVFGGIAAASSVTEIPSSVATFVGFSYILGVMGEKSVDKAADETRVRSSRG